MNNEGNLIDSFYLANIIALLNYKKPFIDYDDKNKISINLNKNKQPLSIYHIPILITFAFFNNSKIIIADPTVYNL